MAERPAEARGDPRRRLDRLGTEVERPEHDVLPTEHGEHRGIEARLRRLDRDDSCAAVGKLRQEGVAGGLHLHGVGIAETEMHHGGRRDAGERPVDTRDAVAPRPRGKGLEIGLIDLDDVGAGGLHLTQLIVDGAGAGLHERLKVLVVLIEGELGQGERAWHRDLDRAVRVAAYERDLLEVDRRRTADRRDHARHRDELAGTAPNEPWAVGVDAFRCRGEAGEALSRRASPSPTMVRPVGSWSCSARTTASSCAALRS